MRLALAAVAILPVVLAAAWPSPPAPSGDYIKVEMRGRLRTGIMAIGGETTGVVITSRGASWELDLEGLSDGVARSRSLDGRTVVVKGSLEMRPGVERRERAIVTVTSLEAVPSPAP